MKLVYRPLDTWPGALRTSRTVARFSTPLHATLAQLTTEVHQLAPSSTTVVLELAMSAADLYADGSGFRARARTPTHPGVVVSFTSPRLGPLRFFTDRYSEGRAWRGQRSDGEVRTPGWQCNLRAIVLGMEGLRTFARHGLGSSDEQYRGWQQLGAGVPMGATVEEMSADTAGRLLLDACGWQSTTENVAGVLADPEHGEWLYRTGSKVMHPDQPGGSDSAQRALNQAIVVLRGMWNR